MGGRYGADLLTLNQFHPKAAAVMLHFRRWLIQQFGDVKRGWVAILNQLEMNGDESTKVAKYRFITGIEQLHFPGDCEFVYSCLDYEGAGYVTFHELDWLTKDPLLAHRQETAANSSPKKKSPRKLITRQKTDDSKVDFNQFRSHLEQKYGNLLRCWYRWCIVNGDAGNSAVMTWDDFAARMKEEGYLEKLIPKSETWSILKCGKHGGAVSVTEFAPATCATLSEFLTFLEKFGTVQIGWKQVVQQYGEPIGKFQFCLQMEALGFDGNSPAVFGILDVELKSKITQDWMHVLPVRRRLDETRGDVHMAHFSVG
jgi:hypothetical protein